jgi:hypothetical protein
LVLSRTARSLKGARGGHCPPGQRRKAAADVGRNPAARYPTGSAPLNSCRRSSVAIASVEAPAYPAA